MGLGVCITHLLARISSDVMSGVLVSFAIQDTLSAMALVGLYRALFCSRSPLGQQLLCLATRLNSSHAYTDLLNMHASVSMSAPAVAYRGMFRDSGQSQQYLLLGEFSLFLSS